MAARKREKCEEEYEEEEEKSFLINIEEDKNVALKFIICSRY